MENLDTAKEWQDYFNGRFPDGASVYRPDDSLHFLTAWFNILNVDGGEPTLQFFPAHIPTKVMSVTVESVDETSDIETTLHVEGGPDWVLSTNFDAAMGAELRKQREEYEAEKALYAD